MPATALTGVLPGFRLSVTRTSPATFSDGELLERFIQGRDGKAFESLLRQHGPMVLGVCRRILRNESDAEDAFQATFLVLVRKASSIVPRSMVGNWLYGVAYFTATKARAMSTKRLVKERTAAIRPASPDNQDTMNALQAILDQELQTLPPIYRSAIVLCDLEGKSIKAAAQQLGCPFGTVGARLTRGRSMLAQRISRRKGELASGILLACLANASAAVPPSLLSYTSQALLNGTTSSKVLTLTNSVMQTMLLSKLKLLAIPFMALILSAGTVATGFMGLNPSTGGMAVAFSGNHLPQPAPQKPVKAANFVWSVAFTPNGQSLVVSEGTNLVRLWDLKTQLPGKSFEGAKKYIRSVAVSPDGTLVAGGGDEGILYVWDAATQKLLYQYDTKNTPVLEDKEQAGILTVVFSPDGQALACASYFGKNRSAVSYLEAKSGKPQWNFYCTESHIPRGAGIALAFHPQGNELALLQHGHFTGIRFLGLDGKSTEKPTIAYESPLIPESVAYSPDGNYLVTGGIAPAMPNPNDARLFGMPQGHVKVWDLKKGKVVETLFDDSDGNVKTLVFTNNNKLIAGTTVKLGQPFQTKDGLVGILGGMYACWDTRNWAKLWNVQIRGGLTFGMSLSADDQTLAIANSAGCTLVDIADVGGPNNKGMRQIAVTPESPPAK